MYRALYRKWRPQRFEDVVGQRGIVTALRNQIATGRVGPRLPVHTACAAPANHLAPRFLPRRSLPAPAERRPLRRMRDLQGIDNGSILDVVEMDAASNNGVDDIRDLRDETAYTPSACQYKVYIIDEVHMLSTAAFNALLKTLEEPRPMSFLFWPPPRSRRCRPPSCPRCQRYDFTPHWAGGHRTAGGVYRRGRALGTDIGRSGADRPAWPTVPCAMRCPFWTPAQASRQRSTRTGCAACRCDRPQLFVSHLRRAGSAGRAAALAQLAQLRQQSVDVKRLTEELIAHYPAP